MKDFLLALSFLTILPVGRCLPSDERGPAPSMAFYPVVGLLIGLLLALSYFLLSLLFPRPLVLWLTLGLSALLTGGLHLDGFADMMDGLGARGTKERMLEVMRDSRIGTFGVVGLILLMGAKYLALDSISKSYLPHALIMMAVMGRNSMVMVCYRSSYARPGEGLARPFTEHLGSREVAISLAFTFVIALSLMGVKGAGVALATCLLSFGYRFFMIKKLGGVTGDILGAANEIAELLCLILFVMF